MSSIIKSGRARNQGIMDLSERQVPKVVVEEIYEDVNPIHETNFSEESVHVTSMIIEEKKEELQKIQAEIDTKLAEADQMARVILNDAYSKAAKAKTDSDAEYERMLTKAHEEKEQILRNAKEQALAISEQAISEKEQMLRDVEGEVVETLITLLQHIVSDELQYHNDWLYLIVRKMLQKPDIEEGAVLLVSSDLYESIEKQEKEKLLLLRKLAKINVDESLNDKTCKLVTSQGSIEYDVSQGLEKVISELRILKSLTRSQDDQYK